MCRFVAYLGKRPALLKEVLDAPENSLIDQSKAARIGPSRLNADGFGIGWYQKNVEESPAIFKSILPAWNDQNLLSIASKVESNCFCGHVRASTIGGVNYENCHPFAFAQYMFVHNGSIFGMEKIRQRLSSELHDPYFSNILGRTDSEYFFALLMDYLHHLPAETSSLDLMEQAMRQAIAHINKLQEPHRAEDHARINTVLTNGREMVVTRYTSGDPNNVLPVYYTVGDQWDAHTKYSKMLPIKDTPNALLIATEPLTTDDKGWQEIPANHLLKIDAHLNIEVVAI
jgi:predicted glutamine amidotransferase